MTTPSWLIERLAAQELPEAQARELLARPDVQEELARIALSDEQLLAQHPPARVVRELQRRRQRPLLWLAAAAAAGLALLLLRPAPEEHIATRGLRPHLVVYRKTARGVERLADRAAVRGGDMLQLAYVAAGRKYGVVASIDGHGQITFHLPERAGTAVSLSDSGQSALPHAFELDDTPGRERFVFVTADEPFPTQRVSDALRDGSQLEAATVTLEKVP